MAGNKEKKGESIRREEGKEGTQGERRGEGSGKEKGRGKKTGREVGWGGKEEGELKKNR